MKGMGSGLALLWLLGGTPNALALQETSYKEQLAEAEDLLGRTEEAEVRRGGELCVRLDSTEAVELLLDVLDETVQTRGLPEAHYRDIVWDSLIAIRDPYAQGRIEQELAENEKNADVRYWCAELLGIYGQRDFGETLTKALSDKDPRVRRAAARSLGMIGYQEAAKGLLKQARNKDPRVRAEALIALARLDPPEHAERFTTALSKDKDGGARCALLGAVPDVYPDRLEALSVSALEDDDWRPRIQAVQNLADVRTKNAVDRLVEATLDARPVVRERAFEALSALTGQKHGKPEAWEAWWKANREEFDFPEGRSASGSEDERTVATYHGIRLVSDHVAFLIDKSAAMAKPNAAGDGMKDVAAYDELENLLTNLEGELTFNVYTYERDVEAFENEPVELTRRTAKKALEFVEDQPCQDRKDIWQVLELVVSDPQLDTVYLLSSGEPDIGLYAHSNRVTRYLEDLNRFHEVVVHAIAFTDNEWHQTQLEAISSATGGEFRVVE